MNKKQLVRNLYRQACEVVAWREAIKIEDKSNLLHFNGLDEAIERLRSITVKLQTLEGKNERA